MLKSFFQDGVGLSFKNIYKNINKQIPFKYHTLSRECQIAEQRVQWEQQRIKKYPTQYVL